MVLDIPALILNVRLSFVVAVETRVCLCPHYEVRPALPDVPTARGRGAHILLDIPALILDGHLSFFIASGATSSAAETRGPVSQPQGMPVRPS